MSDRGPSSSEQRLILASASPRRSELLRQHGYTFDAVHPCIEEPKHLPADVAPAQHAEALSFFKASAVADETSRGLILGADTVVSFGGRIFGKPVDVDDARRILRTLGGTTHQVITGVTLLDATTRRRDIRHDVSDVSMIELPDDELNAYLASDAWVGKAGAYGVQDRADAYIKQIGGSYTNVVGLPIELLARMLADWDE